MNTKHVYVVLITLLGAMAWGEGRAQTVYTEDFTGANTTNQWYFFNGACLTAGSSTSTTSPGLIPSCKTIWSSYYSTRQDSDHYLVGGNSGYLGGSSAPSDGSTQTADPVGSGALRFTNGSPYGHQERGAILSANTFATGQGIQVTFKTLTYLGDSGGAGKDGADGISFFLMDGSKPAGIGATGGSLAYSCSNTNSNYDGLNGGYVGLGIDEYGNFLNGSNLVSGYGGGNSATGDNAAYGYGYKPNRIGMRGAGSISWAALNGAYGTNQGSTHPYYPSTMSTAYSSYSYACSAGTLYNNASCYSCPDASAYITSYGAPSSKSGGSVTFNGTQCVYTKGSSKYYAAATYPATVTVTPTSATLAVQAVQQACSTGHLYNYATATTTGTATDVGTATLDNAVNTAGILDYAPIPNAYKELTGFTIANESATTRAQGTPIFYNLQITQTGLLSLSYSTGGAYSSVIKNQSITASNGNLPASFRFGFAGSTGGSTNIHEIMCFKAASANTSGSSATVNEKQAAKVQAGTQAYFAFYNPNNWTGALTANYLVDTAGVVSVSPTANWDASCVLTGTASGAPSTGGGCASTNTSGPTSALPASGSRVMLTWDTKNNVGIPFEWASLNTDQQAALNAGDVGNTATTAQYRLNYLRGDRSNEVSSLGVGLYRARDSLLGDIVDSSPSWVGPPTSPYTATWKDRLQPAASMPENTGTQTYLQYAAAAQTRLNVVYAGANDGFLHGFRAGSFDANGNYVANSSTPNDGQEVLAYMPGSTLVSTALPATTGGCTVTTTTGTVVQNIHGWTPAITSGGTTTPECETPELDYSNARYGHNFFVDATPGTGELYYGGVWHTWLVGGLGIGGAAIYALDVTDPTVFSESTPSKVVMGEWNASTISCANTSTACNSNLGNTFGSPQIRRLHNGNWGVIFGNGFGSTSGDAGIYIMSIDQTSGAKTFYYLSTGTSGANGISYTTPADLDGDHITDYVYAGDLKGNVWRFDLTAADPTLWGASNINGVSVNASSTAGTGPGLGDGASGGGGGSPVPLFTAPSGQPITTQLLAISSLVSGGAPRMMIEFGTGQRTQITNMSSATYVGGTQGMYGVWDWKMAAWNASTAGSPYASLTITSTSNPTSLASPYTLVKSNLQAQTLAVTSGTAGTAAQVVDGTNVSICWQSSTACSTGNTKFGWYASLPSSHEQVIFNPVFFQGAFLVNTTVPANNTPTACTTNQDTGFTYALSIDNGGVFASAFPTFKDPKTGTVFSDSTTAGVETNATGSVYVVQTAEGKANIVYQTVSGTPGAQQINIPSNTKAKRLTWIERR